MNDSKLRHLYPSRDDDLIRQDRPADQRLANQLAQQCFQFLGPLLVQLDQQLDLRLVRTLANTITALIRHRNRSLALLLSELGAYLTSPKHAPAGTKRLGNLLHSNRWKAQAIDDYLLRQGKQRVQEEAERVPEGKALCILDSSVLEKPESTKAQGLSPVISSKARRLAKPRPKLGKGYYRGKPGGPIVVPGFNWVGALVTGWADQGERRPITLGAWHWYAKPKTEEINLPSEVPYQRQREAQREVVERVVEAWGRERLLHVWDRGLSGGEWLGEALDNGWDFVVRWKKRNRLRPAEAESVGNVEATESQRDKDGVVAWKLTAGLRAWGQKWIVNPRDPKQPISVRYAARPVCLLGRDEVLWLVVVRLGKSSKRRRGSGEPWRLLTSERVETTEQCWRIVEAYIARWNIEQMLRYGKSELGVESIRVRDWEARHKLLAMVGLAYGFLIELLNDGREVIVPAILRWAHRTGKQGREALRPLYRLRAGLSALWKEHTPIFQGFP